MTTASAVLPYHSVPDPVQRKRTYRDFVRERLCITRISDACATLLANGEDLGHKVILWEGVRAIVEKDVDPDIIKTFREAGLTDYIRSCKCRGVYRERVELNAQWKPTGQVAERLRIAAPTA